jgi:RimJ/RimL family protein N-acetyltransferase
LTYDNIIQYPEFRIQLRNAVPDDRLVIYQWLAKSNVTESMMGEPHFPDNPVPSYDEFTTDFSDDFFNADSNSAGKCFIIMDGNIEVGTICYDLIHAEKKQVLLDIWLRDEQWCGKGYGSVALRLLCMYLFKKKDIRNFYIAPSLRNVRAIRAYERAGFTQLKMSRDAAMEKFGVDIFEYDDNVVMRMIINS